MLKTDVMSPAIEKMNTYCKTMAECIAPWLDQIDLNHYQAFLNMMYHYTYDSGKRLQHAASQAQTPEIKGVFAQLAREELYHYRLAEADLSTFNQKPGLETPKIVSDFHQFWMTISPAEEYQYLGAMFVLENVAEFIKPHLMPHFARLNVGPERAKFILTHLVADENHGEQLRRLCEDADDNALHLLDLSAGKASSFWIEMHRQALA